MRPDKGPALSGHVSTSVVLTGTKVEFSPSLAYQPVRISNPSVSVGADLVKNPIPKIKNLFRSNTGRSQPSRSQ